MDIKETNLITGEVTERNYTAEEKAERDANIAEYKAALAAEVPPTLAEKLDSIGLTLSELKKALGL